MRANYFQLKASAAKSPQFKLSEMMSETIGWWVGINKIVNSEYCSYAATWALQSGRMTRFRSTGNNVVRARDMLNAGLDVIDAILRWVLSCATCWHRQADKLVIDAQQQLKLDLAHPTNITQRAEASFIVETVGFVCMYVCVLGWEEISSPQLNIRLRTKCIVTPFRHVIGRMA